MREPREVIVRPIVTEKSTAQADERGVYAFMVAKDANKIEIRNAVEKLFDVKVSDVRTMNYRGKLRRVGRSLGKRAAFKKAVVTLADDGRIDVYEGV
jgi:large subunit ribosomal protein L23